MLWPYRSGPVTRTAPARLDASLPPTAWRLEHHGIHVAAEPEAALAAALAVRLRDTPVIGALFAVRGLPHDGGGAVGRFFSTPPFLILDEERGREVVFGVAGPFWRWGHGRMPDDVPRTAAELRAALAAGRMAAIGNFRADPAPGGARLWTETWVSAPGPQRRAFVAYWTLIGPFSAWTRRILLRAARRGAERAAPARPGASGR
jgi:hypothetical protein